MPPLSSLRVFEAAARHRSFKEAALELHVTPTAVSHQIRQLETALSLKLFERGVRQVRLTVAGQQLFPALRDGFDSFERAIAAVQHASGSKTATLSSTVAFMAKRLAPKVGSFGQAHPDWTLRLAASDKTVDLAVEADAAIRYGGGQYAGLITEPLFQDRFAPVCSPSLAPLARQGLDRMALVHFEWGAAVRDDERAVVWRTWVDHAGLEGIELEGGLFFTDEIHALQATVAGQGIGLLSLTLVAQELASGVLVQPFELTLESFRYDLVYSRRAANASATKLLCEWVKSEFSKG